MYFDPTFRPTIDEFDTSLSMRFHKHFLQVVDFSVDFYTFLISKNEVVLFFFSSF